MAEQHQPLSKDKLLRLAQQIDSMDYFQILGLELDANDTGVKIAFYNRSRRFHPDRYYGHEDLEYSAAVSDIYKQISEAYNVLKTPRWRQDYAAAIKADREKNLRFKPGEEKAADKKPYDGGTGPGAKYYKLAQKAFIARDLSAARNNIKLALSMEKNNEEFKKLEGEIAARG